MPGFRDLLRALQGLHIPRTQPVLVHASLSAFGQVSGGAEAVGWLLATTRFRARNEAHGCEAPSMTLPHLGPQRADKVR